ncbi:MAG: carbonate dehydratase [Bacteroidetes bacterium]|nr:carbonate dehydratase [Bacteroidota bacterium]
MNESYHKLIKGNKIFSESRTFNDPEYFKKLSLGQKPEHLWIGCSDSRVPANEITNTKSGEIFVHRNIANLVIHTDLNLISVLEYAVNVLEVKDIIVCGHYGCGGVRAAMTNNTFGVVDKWLRNIKDVYHKNQTELEKITDQDSREDRLTELNVMEQVLKLAETKIVQKAWHQGRNLEIHGWVYGLNNGLIKELNTICNDIKDVPEIYRYKF